MGFSIIGLIYSAVLSGLFKHHERTWPGFALSAFLFISITVINYIKYLLIKNEQFENEKIFNLSRVIELVIIVFIGIQPVLDLWAYIVVSFLIITTSLCRGTKTTVIYATFAIAMHIVLKSIDLYISNSGDGFHFIVIFRNLISLFIYYLASIMLAILCGKIYHDNSRKEEENKRLLGELGLKYEQLAVAQEEIKSHYEKLKETNIKLEDTNKRLTNSIAEFYTLQQISQAIGSILDTKELLKYVNDIILGVMGVNYSTIIIYDEKRDKLKVHTTNVKNQDELISLNDEINCSLLKDVLDNCKPIIENFVDSEEYKFTKGREVNSIVCVPFGTKSRQYGLMLIEHKYNNAFDEDNVRLLDIIGQQVGIAIENAHLYQQMQELATIDGLTDVYNRLYFQERLLSEFKSAQEGNYQLSLAIFDIDHFKRFNDTFGHLFGDKVLKTLADLVKRCLRSSDIIARYGGEEFIILFPRTGLKEAYDKVEALRQKVAASTVKDNLVTASVTASFGISCYPDTALTQHELLRSADNALYEAKESGRNCIRVAHALIKE